MLPIIMTKANKINLEDVNEEAFHNKYVKLQSGCWEWVGPKNWHGYGMYYQRYKKFRAHRLSYFLKNPEFDQSLVICHKCDNPLCVNPDHLFPGTMMDNVEDMIEKGRQKKKNGSTTAITKAIAKELYEFCLENPTTSFRQLGEKFGFDHKSVKLAMSKISPVPVRKKGYKINQEIADKIRWHYRVSDETQTDLAKKYSLNLSNVHNVLKNKIWKNDSIWQHPNL